MNIIKQIGTNNITVKKFRKIEYIVIHYTAGISSESGKAKSIAKNWFNNVSTKASADYIIDDENIVLFNPDINNIYTWHCGGKSQKKLHISGAEFYRKCKNDNSIGIELCSNNKLKKITNPNDENWFFTEKVENNAINLIVKLMKEYNIPIENVIRHYDVNSKLCPGIIGWNEDSGNNKLWTNFKLKIKEQYEKENYISIEKTEYERLKRLEMLLIEEIPKFLKK